MHKTLTSTLVAAALSLGTFAASAQNADTPRIDARQAKQEQRIDQGIASGELTRREAHRLNRQQNAIDKAENKAKADGVVTGKERKALTRAQNSTSKRIHRQKHDAQERKGT
jgi:opacity protein-like surface antigen